MAYPQTEPVKRSAMRVGDLLTFKAATRCRYRKATRKIKGFDHLGRPLVGYSGWPDFIVMPREIISVPSPSTQDIDHGFQFRILSAE